MIFEESGANVLVVGVGGAGNNAVNRMIESGITSAEFVAVNTDAQVLKVSKTKETHRLQIGIELTRGRGAGAKPSIGEQAAIESIAEIQDMLKNVDLLFITAGMGGGTGTGAAPVIAEEARKMGILTIAIVTRPFSFEGPTRAENAQFGITKIAKYVDTLIIIPNDKLLRIGPKDMTITESFRMADNVLRIGIQGISDLIAKPSLINLDFADVQTIIQNSGKAHLGMGEGEGENAMLTAVQQAVSSPLLESSISGAKGVIMYIAGGEQLIMDEIQKACMHIRRVSDAKVNFIFGTGIEPELGDKIRITIIATGYVDKKPQQEESHINTQNVSNGGNAPSPMRPKPAWANNDGQENSNSFANPQGVPNGGFTNEANKPNVNGGFVNGQPNTNGFAGQRPNNGYPQGDVMRPMGTNTPPQYYNPQQKYQQPSDIDNEQPKKVSFLDRLRNKKKR